ncbi:hypothetical protein HDU98_006190, partial [Podochytrium sp. JEL0797]
TSEPVFVGFNMKQKGVYVGEVTVMNVVRGTAVVPDSVPTIKPEDIAEKFAEIEAKRDVVFATIAAQV